MLKMEVKEVFNTKNNNSRIILFRFELNPTQKLLFLIISVVGVLFLPFMIAGDIFLNLFQSIFVSLPAYLSNPDSYHDDYLFYNFSPVITSIIIYSIFFSLSIFTLKKLLKTNEKESELKRNIILQDRIVNWLGFKISHGQSLFIFSVALIGMLFIIQKFIYSFTQIFRFGVLESLTLIPDGPNLLTSNVLLTKNAPLAILVTFFILCLYSLFITRRGKPMTSSKKITKNYGLFMFIVSFFLFILLSVRIFSHFVLFTYNPPNPYQNNDFIITISFFCICLAMMIKSYYMREYSHKVGKKDIKLSWFNIELTPQRALILLSIAILYTLFFTIFYLVSTFLLGIFGFRLTYYSIIFHGFFFGIIIFCYYPIGKISKDHHLVSIVENIENFSQYETNWFKFRLNRRHSVIFLSVSSGLIPLYVFQLVSMNLSAQSFLSEFTPSNTFLLFSFPVMTTVIIIILAVNIYTIKKTIHSIKLSPSEIKR